MPEFTYNPVQLVQAGQPVLLNTALACRRGLVLHRNESGIITLRGGNRYQVTYNGNIAVPEGGTAQEIGVAIAIDGEPILTSRALFTPSEAEEYGNVTSTDIITVPCGCCANVSVENTSDIPINVQNANLVVTKVGG